MISLLRFVLSHPLCRGYRWSALCRVLAWQIASRLWQWPAIVPFAAGTSLIMERGMTGATGNYYCGLHEFEDMAFVVHLLRAGDLFVDVGANVGSYSILAAGATNATVFAVEPVPATFHRLQANVQYNRLEDRVTLRCAGIGDADGSLRFTAALDTVNHVATEGDESSETVEVPTFRLDSVLAGAAPLCLKIDVEGFERKVIDGATQTLHSSTLRAVLMELIGGGDRYGDDEDGLHQTMIKLGFEPHDYEPFTRKLQRRTDRNRIRNTLYLRDLEFIRERVASAPDIELPWRRIARPDSAKSQSREQATESSLP